MVNVEHFLYTLKYWPFWPRLLSRSIANLLVCFLLEILMLLVMVYTVFVMWRALILRLVRSVQIGTSTGAGGTRNVGTQGIWDRSGTKVSENARYLRVYGTRFW